MLFVINALAQFEDLGFDQISIDDAKNRLGACPSAPDPSSYSRDGKDTEEQKHENKRHEIELLHVKTDEEKVQLLVIEVQEEKMVAMDTDPGEG